MANDLRLPMEKMVVGHQKRRLIEMSIREKKRPLEKRQSK